MDERGWQDLLVSLRSLIATLEYQRAKLARKRTADSFGLTESITKMQGHITRIEQRLAGVAQLGEQRRGGE